MGVMANRRKCSIRKFGNILTYITDSFYGNPFTYGYIPENEGISGHIHIPQFMLASVFSCFTVLRNGLINRVKSSVNCLTEGVLI